MVCLRYPCFFNGKPKREQGKIVWDCSSCRPARKSFNKKLADRVLERLKRVRGIGDEFYILSEAEKRDLLLIECRQDVFNAGVVSALSRVVSIVFSHNSEFRDPGFPIVLFVEGNEIVGEMTDSGKKFYGEPKQTRYILPPIPFPEAEVDGIVNVVSASPSREGHEYIKRKIKIKGNDASLILGFDFA